MKTSYVQYCICCCINHQIKISSFFFSSKSKTLFNTHLVTVFQDFSRLYRSNVPVVLIFSLWFWVQALIWYETRVSCCFWRPVLDLWNRMVGLIRWKYWQDICKIWLWCQLPAVVGNMETVGIYVSERLWGCRQWW